MEDVISNQHKLPTFIYLPFQHSNMCAYRLLGSQEVGETIAFHALEVQDASISNWWVHRPQFVISTEFREERIASGS